MKDWQIYILLSAIYYAPNLDKKQRTFWATSALVIAIYCIAKEVL